MRSVLLDGLTFVYWYAMLRCFRPTWVWCKG